MRVILLQNIDNVGKKYELKEVKNGYARNYLIPNNLAKLADEQNLKWAKEQQEKEIKKEEAELKRIGDIASQIDELEIEIKVKIGDKGQFFEKITDQKISKRLKEIGHDIGNAKIELDKPIEELGEFPVKIKFPHNLESEIKLIIIEQTEQTEQELNA